MREAWSTLGSGVALCGVWGDPPPTVPQGPALAPPGWGLLSVTLSPLHAPPRPPATGRAIEPRGGEGAIRASQPLWYPWETEARAAPGLGVGAQQGDGRAAVGQKLKALSSLRLWTSPASCSEPEDLGLNFTLPPSSCVEMSQAPL